MKAVLFYSQTNLKENILYSIFLPHAFSNFDPAHRQAWQQITTILILDDQLRREAGQQDFF